MIQHASDSNIYMFYDCLVVGAEQKLSTLKVCVKKMKVSKSLFLYIISNTELSIHFKKMFSLLFV